MSISVDELDEMDEEQKDEFFDAKKIMEAQAAKKQTMKVDRISKEIQDSFLNKSLDFRHRSSVTDGLVPKVSNQGPIKTKSVEVKPMVSKKFQPIKTKPDQEQ